MKSTKVQTLGAVTRVRAVMHSHIEQHVNKRIVACWVLSLACLTDFILSDSEALARLIDFSFALYSAIRFDRNAWWQRSHTFCLI